LVDPARVLGIHGDRLALAEGSRPVLLNPSTPGVSRGEAHIAAYRYGIVLLLLLATFVFLAIGPTGDWVPLVAVILQGATLLAALAASASSPRLFRIGVAVVIVSLVAAAIGLFAGEEKLTGSLFLLNLLLVAGAPVVIIHALVRRRVVDIRTVLGAVCVYILLGMLWSFAYAAIGTIQSEPFFLEQKSATVADYLYFSFVTLTTVGYGDLTAAGGLGRALAVLEALIGQLYLVTVIALLVSNLVPRRRGPDRDEAIQSDEPS
jgi:hypothetical protein